MASKTVTAPKNIPAKVAIPPKANGAADGKKDESIRVLAYKKWEAAGKPVGDGLSYWLEAERELSHA